MDKKNLLILLFLGLALVAVLILVISLPEFHLRGGQPFPLNKDVVIPVLGSEMILPGGNIFFWIIRGIIALMIIGLPIYIIISLFSPEGRRRLLSQILVFVVFVFFLDMLSRAIQKAPQEEQAQSEEAPQVQAPGVSSVSSQTEQFQAKTPEWLVWAASIGVALFLTGLVALGLWLYYRRQFPRPTSLDRLAQEAEKAAAALQEGGDFKNIIIRCYYQMSQILYSERGIRRDMAMTPREFEQALEEKGLPSEPIQYLTRIFEDVRYGNMQPARREEEKATWYLTVIAEASRQGHSR